MLIRLFMNEKTQENIKNNKRLSKTNYISRKGYLIENLILEKWLLCNYSAKKILLIAYNIIDLEVCYG